MIGFLCSACLLGLLLPSQIPDLLGRSRVQISVSSTVFLYEVNVIVYLYTKKLELSYISCLMYMRCNLNSKSISLPCQCEYLPCLGLPSIPRTLDSFVKKSVLSPTEPDIPHPSELLDLNKTSVTIKLNAFGTGGCPVLYFVIEYRRDVMPKYVMVANNISPRDTEYTIRGLEPATRYFIKVTAHNTAG